MTAPCKKCGNPRKVVQSGDRIRYRCAPCEAAYQRENYAANAEKIRVRKAKWMAEARKHPERGEKIRETQRRSYSNRGKDSQRERLARMQQDQPFRWRSYLLRRLNSSITPEDLEGLWNRQGGICALTGRSLTLAEADIDHIIPKSRGGTTTIDNLRWVWSRANEAKGNMLDEEFLSFCHQVAEWLGRLILEADSRLA